MNDTSATAQAKDSADFQMIAMIARLVIEHLT